MAKQRRPTKRFAEKTAWRERVEARVGLVRSHRKSHILSFVHVLQLLSFEAPNCICSEGKRTKTVQKENLLFLATSRITGSTRKRKQPKIQNHSSFHFLSAIAPVTLLVAKKKKYSFWTFFIHFLMEEMRLGATK